jgi:hypothetical protein
MKRTFTLLMLIACFAAATAATGSVVQLPTFSNFGVSTTVEVPDSGGGFVGGVGRSASGATQVGGPLSPWRNSGIGSQCGASNMHLVATIHDFEAMDQALLAQARGLGRSPTFTQARENPLASGGKDSAPVPLAEIRAQRQQQDAAQRAEWEELLARGDRAADAGKPGAARVYYKMVLRRATSDLQQEAAARLAMLDKSQPQSKVAKAAPSADPPKRQ